MKVSKLANWKTLVALAAGALFAGGAAAVASDAESIAERIKPAGQVRMAGEAGQQTAAADSGEARSGEGVFNQACAACHAGGVLGAPRRGDAGDWADRLPKGMEVLLQHTIEGYNAMPPRGACGNCSDEELEAAVEYMIAGL